MKFSIFCGMVFFILIILLCFPFMIFTELFADLCVNPTQSLARQVTGSTREMILFYTTCRGTDTIRNNFLQARNAIGTITALTTTATDTFCTVDTNVAAYLTQMADVKLQISTIATQVSCPTLKAILLTFFNDSLCGGIYSGIYSIWISQLITSFFLLMLLITSTVLYQYYGVTHKVFAVTTDGEGEDDSKYPAVAVAYSTTGDEDDLGGGEEAAVEMKKIDHDHHNHHNNSNNEGERREYDEEEQ